MSDTLFQLDVTKAQELASEFGTPLYVLDEATFRANLQAYRLASRSHIPFESAWSYASKANSTLALLSIAAQEGFTIDVASEGEFRAALAAGVPAKSCHMHGNNKSLAELGFALSQGIGQIIIDNFDEIRRLSELKNEETEFLLRLAPGVDPKTNPKISTGQAVTKFGFGIADGSAQTALLDATEHGLTILGFHCHVGSQLLDPSAQINGAEALAAFAAEMYKLHRFKAELINVGGGRGIQYTGLEDIPTLSRYCEEIAAAVTRGLNGAPLKPVLAQEPGRSVVASAGVTLYQVGSVKTVGDVARKTFLTVDGGLSDNPRPAMYGSKYQVVLCRDGADAETKKVTISGKHCETDTLFEDMDLASDVQSGDILQVLATGAYNASMASNYNRFPRPATVLLRESGDVFLAQERETYKQMLERERVPDDLKIGARR